MSPQAELSPQAGEESFDPGPGQNAEAVRNSLKTLSRKLDFAEPSSAAILLSRALDLVTEAEQMLADQRSRIVQLERLSVTDELTELYNRRGFMTTMRRLLALAQRHGDVGMIAMLDLDGFKPVNDLYGHPVGDRALVEVGRCIRRTLRETDIIARLGGDEFAIGLNRCSLENGRELILRIEQAIADLSFDAAGTPIALSASIGAAPYDGSRSLEDVISTADSALYEAKRARKRALSDS